MVSKLTAFLSLFILIGNLYSQIEKPLNSRLGKEYSGSSDVFITSGDIDSLVYDLIEDVNEDSVEYFIQSLQDFGARYYDAANRREVSEWILNKFAGFGIEDVKLDSFTLGNSWQYNVVATIPATEPTDKVFVVGAHHDSINRNNLTNAPGADDNASGTAGVLEIARILTENNYQPNANIKFVTFAAEEVGLYGSRDFAKKAKESGMNIRLMINHDMISYSPYSVDDSRLAINHYSGSESFTEIALYCADNFTPFQVYKETLNSSGSDSYSFFQEGFNSVYFEEHDFTPFYHTNNDKLENNNIPFCAEVIKASCATLIYSLVMPAPVENMNLTDANEGTSIYVEWQPSSETDFKEYKIYTGKSAGNYIHQLTTTNSNILIEGVDVGTEYFVGVSVVNQSGYESSIVEKSFIPYNFKLDRGILIVDETADGGGTIMKPTDEEVDEYYTRILKGYKVSEFDVIKSEALSVADIGDYSTVIWHGDDLANLTAGSQAVEDLKRYLNAGGNFIYSGYLPSKAFEMNNNYPSEFEKGDFIYDYLKIERVEKSVGTRFVGSASSFDDYEDMYVDTLKTKKSLNYHLQNIESIYAESSAQEIYYYDTQFDSTSAQGVMKGMPVAVEYMGDDYKAITLSFPLYYMNESEVKMFIDKVMVEKFDEPTGVEEILQVPIAFSLSQNYPNPFNPTTTIEYSIPAISELAHSELVSLKIHDVLGREVKTLVDGYRSAGTYKTTFNASALTSGVYFYTLKAGQYVDSKKMMLVK